MQGTDYLKLDTAYLDLHRGCDYKRDIHMTYPVHHK